MRSWVASLPLPVLLAPKLLEDKLLAWLLVMSAERAASDGGRITPPGGRMEALISLIAALLEALNVGISFGEAALSGLRIPVGACLAVRMLFIAVADEVLAVLPILDDGREVLNAGRFDA